MKPDRIIGIAASFVLAPHGWRDTGRRSGGTGYRNRREPSLDHVKALESAVADIQLLGSPERVRLARQFALEFASEGTASLDPLPEAMRVELR